MNFAKVLTHPDRDQIISRLTSGESSRDVSAWLKEKYPYPKDTSKHISYNTLNEFRTKHLNIHGAAMTEMRTMVAEARGEEIDQELSQAVKKNPTYREKVNQVIDTEINWRMKLMQFMSVVETRFEQLFDRTQDNPSAFKADYVMIDWMRTMMEMVEKIRKIEGAPDQIIQHNVTIQMVEEHSALIQEALRQTFAEIDLETSLILMDKYSENLEKLKNRRENISKNRIMEKICSVVEEVKVLPQDIQENNDESFHETKG